MTIDDAGSPTVDEVAARVSSAGLGMMQTLSIHIGDRLGWYRALADGAPRTASQLADATGTDERYAREWLEQQAVYSLLEADGDDPGTRTFRMSAAVAEVLTDERSLSYAAPFARAITAAAVRMPDLLEAYRTGGGVGWEAYGEDMREAQADTNRPWFERQLADALLSVPELAGILTRPGVRVAEIGFGGGHASIAIALGFPEARIDGFDVDAASVELARRNAADAGVADRIGFHLSDGAAIDGTFDIVFAFECIHDMPQPVPVLEAARAALAPGGLVVVMDEAVADAFTAPGDEVERVMYGFSILVCLPDGRSHTPSEATGTVMRRSTLEGYAHRAGFAAVDVLPIDGFASFRFYALRG
ncbi:MAG: methyltransferase domain-containing protein [Leifsonia sp.]